MTQLNYQLLREPRALLNVTLPDGRPLPKDSLIVDSNQQYITSSVDNSVVFINNILASGTLLVAAEKGHKACRLMYPLNEQSDLENYYETLRATMKPLAQLVFLKKRSKALIRRWWVGGILLLLAFSQGLQAQQCQVRMSPESFHYGNKT